MSTYTFTATEATVTLRCVEGFDLDEVEAVVSALADLLPDADPEQLTDADLDELTAVLDYVEDDTLTTITFRPHWGDAVTRTDTWAGWVTLARQWWENVSDKDEVAAELGAPGYGFESIYYNAVADDDALAEWYATQAAAVTGWLGTYRGVVAWAGWDKQPATIKLDR